jgi:hypothetical protein
VNQICIKDLAQIIEVRYEWTTARLSCLLSSADTLTYKGHLTTSTNLGRSMEVASVGIEANSRLEVVPK